jgi:pimeloyl-ACP methyl ester carboxylesterase
MVMLCRKVSRLAQREFPMGLAAGLVAGAAAAGGGATDTVGRSRRLDRGARPLIAYDDLGSGDTALLFLPGWCVSGRVFQSLPEQCAERHRVLSLDWRGHGESGSVNGEFGQADLLQDAIDVLRAAKVRRVIPVALAHSGWVALELCRQLGSLVPGVLLIDWLVLEAPAPFLEALRALQQPALWASARDQLFALWTQRIDQPYLEQFIRRDMGRYGYEMWARAGREIESAYARYHSPLAAFAAYGNGVTVKHLYSQPDAPEYLAAQAAFSRAHPWFHVHRLHARSHFPMFEVPGEMADDIGSFARTVMS